MTSLTIHPVEARRPAASGARRAAGRRTRSACLLAALLVLAATGLSALACGRPRSTGGKEEQLFRFRLREDPPTLDPALSTDQFSQAVLFNLFRGLVELDPGSLQVRPAIAASWTISTDHRLYTFHLREDAVFHNGRRVTAHDVEFSFMRTLRKETQAPWRWVLEPIAGAREFTDGKAAAVAGLRVVDERTVEVRLTRPFAPFLAQLAMLPAAVVPREVYEDQAKGYLRAPVGCGPFRFARWEQSNFIELQAFDRYYGGRPALDRVLVRIIENRQSALQEYKAGGLDSLDEVPPPDDRVSQEEIGSEILRYPFMATGYIGFNLALPPFKGNVKLRQAFNYAVDKKYLWEVLLPGGNTPANGIIPPGLPGHDPDLPGYPHDQAKARRLLAEAGYPEGRGLPPISLWVNTGEDQRRIVEQVQADLKTIGVNLVIREVDWGAYIKAVEGTVEQPGEAQMFRFGWFLDYPDADAILRPQLHSANFGPGGNFFRYHNPEFDRLVDQALDETDPEARAVLYRKAQRIAVMDDAVWLFLNYYQSSTLFKPYVKGVVPSPLGEFRIPLERLRIEKSPAPR
ncbi:MAG TPA: ABC transporter substrate-binding protein [Candidatus Polarisedimenticolia bacterium]|nr:ABC transporter substrate-binding protein [Candidatus Polarisedimenticolia bacterium]